MKRNYQTIKLAAKLNDVINCVEKKQCILSRSLFYFFACSLSRYIHVFFARFNRYRTLVTQYAKGNAWTTTFF